MHQILALGVDTHTLLDFDLAGAFHVGLALDVHNAQLAVGLYGQIGMGAQVRDVDVRSESRIQNGLTLDGLYLPTVDVEFYHNF
jgi:hypothetical protein